MSNYKLTTETRPLVSETRKKSAREIVLEGIGHQIALLKDPGYKVERVRYAKDDEGNYSRKIISAPPRAWWWKADDGNLRVQIRYGSSQVVELEAGKPTIIGGKSEAELIKVLEQIATDIGAGKLDAAIDAAKERAKRSKAA